jgi:hypothetical protein
MRRHFIALTVCVALAAPLLPAAALAGGRPHAPRARHAVGPAPARDGYRQAEYQPRSAFGSPGGFPLPLPGSAESRLAGVPPGRHAHRPPHRVLPGFPATTFFYAPAALYEPPVDPSPPVINVAPVIYVSPTVYVSPSVVVPQPAPASLAPAAVLPSVVEHPTGRYELRGDGGATPYTWVWIPNAPPAPPVATAPAPEEPRTRSVPPAARSKIYRWTDDDGTTVWTNRVESIPEPQRPGAKKLGQVAAQP